MRSQRKYFWTITLEIPQVNNSLCNESASEIYLLYISKILIKFLFPFENKKKTFFFFN